MMASLTRFEVAQFSAAKRRRSLAVGESPRFCKAPDLKAPEGRRQNRASPLRGFRVALQRFRGFSPPAKFLRHFVAEKRNFKKRQRGRQRGRRHGSPSLTLRVTCGFAAL